MIKESLFSSETKKKLLNSTGHLDHEVLVSDYLIKQKCPNGDTILNNRYRLLRKLGQGSQAKVKLAQLINDFIDENYMPEYFAIKIFVKPFLKKQRSFHRSQSITSASSNGSSKRRGFQFVTALDEVYQEIDIMKKINHPNIVRLFEIIDDPCSDKLYLVMPVADYGECIEWDAENQVFHPNHRLQGKNINKQIKGHPQNVDFYTEDQIRKMCRGLFDALDYLHSELNIVHRDIKPANIMIDEVGSPLIVDFGKAKQLQSDDEDLTNSMEGTYTFLPPESCSFDSTSYSMKKADIWALGITIYILTFNRFPFNIGHTEIDLMENICNFHLQFQGRPISPELMEMLTMLLDKDPNQRASLQELKNCRFIKQESKEQYLPMAKPKYEEQKREEGIKFSFSFQLKQLPSIQLFPCDEGESPRLPSQNDEQMQQ